MITLRKLSKLPPATRLRKIVRLLDGFVEYRSVPDTRYLEGLLDLLREAAPDVEVPVPNPDEEEITLRLIDNLRYELRATLGVTTGDWDLLAPAGFGPAAVPDPPGAPADAPPPDSGRPTGIAVYLESIRSPFNAGSIIRTAVAFGVTRIGMSPECPPVDHPRLLRSARGSEQSVVIERLELAELASGWGPLFALETGGRPIHEHRFPGSGTLLVGSEELGLSREALELAEERISIPMTGVKGSLNVGVACGIALHAWYVKAKRTDSPVD